MITIVDYGMGNLRSVSKAVELYTPDVRVSNNPSDIKSSRGIIIPGDGAFGRAMENLRSLGLVGPILDYVNSGGFLLGICLGFQLLFTSSAEFGEHQGLNIIPGRVKRFNLDGLKVPHMGWNTVKISRDSGFMNGIKSSSFFYFIHSFYPCADDDSWIIGETTYGVTFPCIVGRGNIIATQFHPEKSHFVGLKIIKNFVCITCS
jgi:glutamine amidotransferase